MTIDTENAHYLMVPKISIEAGPHTAWPPGLSQTFLFLWFFKTFPRAFQVKIESYFDMLMCTNGPLVWPLEVHHPGIALTLKTFCQLRSEAVLIAYMTCLSSSTWKPSLLAYWVVLKRSIQFICPVILQKCEFAYYVD